MLRGLRRRHVVASAAVLASLALCVGCSGLLGFSDYSVAPDDASSQPEIVAADAADGGGGDAETDALTCSVDLTKVCYPCDPTTTDQLLNACPATGCIPFDQTRLAGFLSADGGLPPLPPPDGG
jgi:hypothetical protein